MVLLVRNEYKYNSNFRKYVDEYCYKNNCTIEDAFKDDYIKQMFLKFTDV